MSEAEYKISRSLPLLFGRRSVVCQVEEPLQWFVNPAKAAKMPAFSIKGMKFDAAALHASRRGNDGIIVSETYERKQRSERPRHQRLGIRRSS